MKKMIALIMLLSSFEAQASNPAAQFEAEMEKFKQNIASVEKLAHDTQIAHDECVNARQENSKKIGQLREQVDGINKALGIGEKSDAEIVEMLKKKIQERKALTNA
jgi:hypothetical protein